MWMSSVTFHSRPRERMIASVSSPWRTTMLLRVAIRFAGRARSVSTIIGPEPERAGLVSSISGDWSPPVRSAIVCEVTPALGFEQLIETMFSLAEDGKVNRKGMPNPLRLAVIAKHHFGDVRLPFPPAWMQRIGLALGAPLGRMFGFKPTYEPQPPKAPTALGV